MYSVTKRISLIKQPRGGYIKRTDFSVIDFNDGLELNTEENIHPSLIGLTVDYMTRFIMNAPLEDAFKISLMGSECINDKANALKLLSQIKGLDDKSITCACKLAGYDVCYRAGIAGYRSIATINPNKETTDNISTMVQRSLAFWKKHGPITKDGFTFEGGYTAIVSTGDGDYLTKDTIWDFKVSKEEPKSKYTLQLLMYYLMGIHSIHNEFKSITKLGIYNPRKNKAYILNITDIPQNIIDEVSHDVIGYGITQHELKAFKQSYPINTNPLAKHEILKDAILKAEIDVGDIVSHSVFGNGKVLKVEKSSKYQIATVKFENGDKKRILSSRLKIK